MIDFDTLMNTQEDLDPELELYLSDEVNGFRHLQHPMVYSVCHNEAMNALINYRYKMIKERIQKAIDAEQWAKIPFMYERPYRVNVFSEYKDMYTPKQYWQLLSEVYIDTENLNQNIKLWYDLLFSEDIPEKSRYFMNTGERLALKELPEVLTIYRGCSDKHTGYSWTLDRETAKWFANRFNKAGLVLTGTVEKKDCLGLLLGRNEKEIVVDWDKVEIK